MNGPLLETHEALIRFCIFAIVLAIMAAAEVWAPARARHFPRRKRWPLNLAITIFNSAMLRFAFPLLAVGVALWAEVRGLGLFTWLGLPGWARFAAGLLILDLTIYAQHLVMHRVPILWRFHRVHHTDRDVDVTTALRFHPGEIALSMGLKMGFVVAFSIPASAVVVFEVILNAMAMFNHANIHLPRRLEPIVRALLVTPDMHRIHHSTQRTETDSNYGFNLSLWDRVFGTYCANPSQANFVIGLSAYQNAEPNNARFAFLLPFQKGPPR